jgi:hypothetical protein
MALHKNFSGRGLHEPAAYKVRNNTGSTLTKRKVVKRTGYDAVMTVELVTNPATDTVLGIVLDDILDGAIGYVAAQGDFGQFDTTAFSVNDVLYTDGSGDLSLTIAGPALVTVLTSDATDGHLFAYVAIPIPTGGGTAYTAYTYILTPTDIVNGYTTIPATPSSPTETVLQYEGAPSQIYGLDFTVSTNQLTFTGLAAFAASGESITILYK